VRIRLDRVGWRKRPVVVRKHRLAEGLAVGYKVKKKG
jgi:hypothetical protein